LAFPDANQNYNNIVLRPPPSISTHATNPLLTLPPLFVFSQVVPIPRLQACQLLYLGRKPLSPGDLLFFYPGLLHLTHPIWSFLPFPQWAFYCSQLSRYGPANSSSNLRLGPDDFQEHIPLGLLGRDPFAPPLSDILNVANPCFFSWLGRPSSPAHSGD